MPSVPPSGPREDASLGAPMSFGKYVLERRLAVGGTSEVYLARPRHGTEPAPRLVIKRLLSGLLSDPAALGMFATEARLHRMIHHPNVVHVYEAGVVSNEPYLAMEYVDGVDAFRLMRRAQTEQRPIPVAIAAFVARQVADALDAVHNGVGEDGRPLGIVHRDVTPSNIYLSFDGDVRLGDFGIARTISSRPSRASLSGKMQGKYGYLSPEQVCGEPCDQRADIFSLGVVAAELVLGRPLFSGAGQLAVLLAIRDGRIDALHEAKDRLPPGLFDVLAKALARAPDQRFASAHDFSRALESFELPSFDASKLELRELVAWAADTKAIAKKIGGAIKGSSDRLRAISEPAPANEPPEPPTTRRQSGEMALPKFPAPPPEAGFDPADEEPVTARFDERPSRIRFAKNGQEVGPVTFARIIQMIVTSQLDADDEVDLMAQGFRRVADIELLERHLPDAQTTSSLRSPSPPDEVIDLAQTSFLDILGQAYRNVATGFLLVEGRAANEEQTTRREIYLKNGSLFHVGAADASDLLGQNLVRRGLLQPSELDMALAVLAKFEGRLGDTLIALGLVDAMQLFRAIEEQGKERVLRVFSWSAGRSAFYRDVLPARVEFPLELDLAEIMLAGAEVAHPNDTPMNVWRDRFTKKLRRAPRDASPRRRAPLPKPIVLLVDAIGGGMELRHVIMRLSATGSMGAPDALRALEVAIALGLVEIAG